jgi:hypothetical protein
MVQKDEKDIEPAGRERAVLRAAFRSTGLTASATLILSGRGEPAQIQAIVQRLIDMGELANSPGATIRDQIRNMMYQFHIGLDCAGYVALAFLSAMGRTRAQVGLASPGYESLSGLVGRGFSRVSLSDVRAGDIICLGPPPKENVGHRLMVYDAHPATAQELARFDADIQTHNRSRLPAFPFASGRVTVYVVQSSWGNHGNGTLGGVEQGLLMHDEVTGAWITDRHNQLNVSNQPYAHPFEGAYRWTQ